MTTAEKIAQNFQQFYKDFDRTRYNEMVHQTEVILGDDDPTAGEIAAAEAKLALINGETEGVTFPKNGEKITPFEQACLDAASS